MERMSFWFRTGLKEVETMVYFFAATAIILAVAILVIACLTTMTGWIIGSFAETVEQVKKRKNEE